jgi:hypothetical protein
VFVLPTTMRATGTSNFLHVRADSLRWLEKGRNRILIQKSPVIQRRSGVTKFEVDLRRKQFRLAPAPLKIEAVAFLTATSGRPQSLLRSMSKSEMLGKITALQGYGARLPQWQTFSRKLGNIKALEVRRGSHPMEAVQALRSLLIHGTGSR